MSKFLMCGSCPPEALKEVGVGYKEKVAEVINEFKGTVDAVYSTLGEYDLIVFADLPDVESAMNISIELNKLTGITFSTSPAVELHELLKLREGRKRAE